MRAQRYVLLLGALAAHAEIRAQAGSCPNSGFENGDFSNWTGATGWCCPISTSTPGLVSGRHTIMTGNGTDPNTGGVVPVVAPGGGSFSTRLGNANVNSQAEQLSYSMLVDAGNALFVYRYAVVLQDPGHLEEEQPRFQIRMFDQDGDTIDCGQYSVTSQADIPGFELFVDEVGDPVVYKNWTTVGMDLTGYVGQNVTIEFTTGDCSLGAHYGYAYIDCYCSPLQINSTFCPGLAATTLTAPPGFAEYLWSTGETTQEITIDQPTTGQVVSCTLTSVTGCAVTINTVLTPSVLSAAFTHTGDCTNDMHFSDASQVISGPPIELWTWDFGDGSLPSHEQDLLHAFAAPGQYTVMLVVLSDAGCPDTTVQTINVLPAPVAGITAGDGCEGTPILFTDVSVSTVPLISHEWDLGDGSSASGGLPQTHVYAQQGGYDVSLAVTDANGCSDTVMGAVVIYPVPSVDIGPDISICPGEAITLQAGTQFNQIWSTGQGSPSITLVPTGDVWLQVLSPNGCTASDTLHVVFDPVPLVQLNDATVCASDTVWLDAGNTGSTFAWSTGAGTQAIAVHGAGGVFSVIVTNAQGCTSQDAASVAFVPLVLADLGADEVLCDQPVALLDAGGAPGDQYLWDDGSTGQTRTVNASGDYWVQVDNGYCFDTDSIAIVFSTSPSIPLEDQTRCADETVVLDAGGEGVAYHWSTGAATPVIVANASGVYSVTVTNADGCASTASATVTLIDTVQLDLGPDTSACEGGSVVVGVERPDVTYSWNDGSTDHFITLHHSAELVLTISNGYCSASDTVQVRFVPYPAHVDVSSFETCFDDPSVRIELTGGPGADQWLWSTGETTEIIEVQAPGTYIVRSTALPECSTIDTLIVQEFCPYSVYIPNTFTPDGDGTNDLFFPLGHNVRHESLLIFDRWGELIFDGGEDGMAWDGTYRGTIVQIDVYNYQYTYRPIVTSSGELGPPSTLLGRVTVVR